MKHKREVQLSKNQSGFASLVIGLILVVVLALMTTGFAQLSRQEQQQALSSQLAVQANYAAETGINDAFNAIRTQKIKAGDGSTCVKPASLFSTEGDTSNSNSSLNIIDSATGVQYTCVKVTFNSASLVYDLATDEGKSVVTTASVSPSTIKVSWSSNSGRVAVPTSGTAFNKITEWKNASGLGYPAVIQFDITPLKDSSGNSLVDRASLISNTRTYFLYPSNANSGASYPGTPSGSIVTGLCPGGKCTATITMPASYTQFLFHMVSFYDKSRVTISSPGINFDGQVTIDSTGKAKDTLKRIKVTIPTYTTNSMVNYAIEAQNVCKRVTSQGFDLTAGFVGC